jgi:hypothetical protein
VPVLGDEEAEHFLALALRLPELSPKGVQELTFAAPAEVMPPTGRPGMF